MEQEGKLGENARLFQAAESGGEKARSNEPRRFQMSGALIAVRQRYPGRPA